MKHPAFLLVALSSAWLLWSGVYETLTLCLGAASVLFVTWLTIRIRKVDAAEPWSFGLRLITYLPWLLWEILKSNIDVAKIILNPKMPISPRLIRVPARQTTEMGRATYANSITLTPGTISLDIRDGEILVHALIEETAAGLQTGEMGRRVCRLEGQG